MAIAKLLARKIRLIVIQVDKKRICVHMFFNSVNADTGKKSHINTQNCYR